MSLVRLSPAPDPQRAALRVLIVDDEPLARDCMRLVLGAEPGVSIVAECEDGVSAVQAIRAHVPDLVFLDVQMPGLDGFGVIEQVGEDVMPPVVFVTAYDVHAIRAFEVHAMDYVLKPFDDARVLATLDRARLRAAERRDSALGRQLADMVRSWNEHGTAGRSGVTPEGALGFGLESIPESAPRIGDTGEGAQTGHSGLPERPLARFAVRLDDSVRFISVTDVDWIEADRNYIVVHAGETKHRVRASLSKVADLLDPRTFVRIHRSIIVQIDRIREVQPWFGGDYVAILRDGTKLRVSRLRAPYLLRPLG
ncbi:MAG: Sensory transduction protein LytR [Gemmatimonadaceae bacterium]|nr:Sensory transduction protein LytR [Gemmatimonadaceae bacterium]